MKKMGKSIANMTLLMSIIMGMFISCVSGFVMKSYAADTRIATMNGESYWNYNTLVSDLEDKGGQTVTIEMLRDWDYKQDSRFKKPLNVPKNCKLTINMHGHMFRRESLSGDVNGEIIYVYPDATLTIKRRLYLQILEGLQVQGRREVHSQGRSHIYRAVEERFRRSEYRRQQQFACLNCLDGIRTARTCSDYSRKQNPK